MGREGVINEKELVIIPTMSNEDFHPCHFYNSPIEILSGNNYPRGYPVDTIHASVKRSRFCCFNPDYLYTQTMRTVQFNSFWKSSMSKAMSSLCWIICPTRLDNGGNERSITRIIA